MSSPDSDTIRWAIVPVKSLQKTKSRLSSVLTQPERAVLTRHLLQRTLRVLNETSHFDTILVVTRDPLAQQIAHKNSAQTFTETPLKQLNGALTEATHYAQAAGATELLILPTDLPRLTSADLDQLMAARQPNTILICSDTEQLGTNALLLPTHTNFTYQYGENSYALHTAEARRQTLTPITLHIPNISFDLDTPADWHTYTQTNIPPIIYPI